MSRTLSIKSTIPPRTYGQGRKSSSPHALLLRMSYLELERQRCIMETEQLQARAVKLRARIEEIERETENLKRTLDTKTQPLAATGPGAARTPLSPFVGGGKARNGLAIRY